MRVSGSKVVVLMNALKGLGLKPHCLYGASNWLGLNTASPITSPSLPHSLFPIQLNLNFAAE